MKHIFETQDVFVFFFFFASNIFKQINNKDKTETYWILSLRVLLLI